mmetsp:Transcript_16719/g.21748  ORF Transcript_16719/g.21748 Transcript_16719/m.21748 type:complete len:125 (+) Transcript_16719:45-419(+)
MYFLKWCWLFFSLMGKSIGHYVSERTAKEKKMLQGSCYHNVCPKTECEEILYGACTNSTVIDDEKNNISNNVWWLADDEFISDDKKNENKIFKILIQRLKELPKLGIVSCLASSDETMDIKFLV